MKKIFLFFIATFYSLTISYADELNANQLHLRTQISNFLKEEGFVPEIDSDGDIKFKYEGKSYYVSVSSTDNTPMYVTMFRPFEYPTEYSKETVKMASAELNLYKGVKLICLNNSFRIQAELYINDAEAFKYAFYKLRSQINNVSDDVIKECDNVQKSTNTNAGTTNNFANTPSRSVNAFFPIDGLTLGTSTLDDARRLGKEVKDKGDGDFTCDINGHSWWDFSKNDGIFDWLSIYRYESMPPLWTNQFGFSFQLSYNEWLSIFQNLGFNIKIKKSPETKEYQGRKTLSAKIEAISPDQSIEFDLTFDYGNSNGEGHSTNSKNTLYRIRALSNYY